MYMYRYMHRYMYVYTPIYQRAKLYRALPLPDCLRETSENPPAKNERPPAGWNVLHNIYIYIHIYTYIYIYIYIYTHIIIYLFLWLLRRLLRPPGSERTTVYPRLFQAVVCVPSQVYPGGGSVLAPSARGDLS